MTPRRIFEEHPRAVSYLKVALVTLPLILLAILANNEYTNAKVRHLAKTTAERQLRLERLNRERREQAVSYVINRSACAAFSLVDPTIRANKALVPQLKDIINDHSLPEKQRKAAQKRLTAVQLQTKQFRKFRSIYGTIPSDFDCKTLPKTPPTP